MNKKAIWIIVMMFFLIMMIGVETKGQSVENRLIQKALEINEIRVKYDPNLNMNNLATYEQIENRVHCLKIYSKKLVPEGYHWKRLWKDSYAIAWQESWFVNYIEHDNGKGFGWTALQWTTCKDMAEKYEWNWHRDKTKIDEKGKLQAKYMIGYIVWLYEFYDQNRGKALTGYNKGLWVDENYVYDDYWLNLAGRINQIDKWLGGQK